MTDKTEIESFNERYAGSGSVFDSLPSQKSIEGWLIFVNGIHEEAQEDDINDAFSNFGTIKNLHLNLDRRTGYVKGYALVEYANFDEARNAIEGMNGGEILEKKIQVDWAFKKPPKKDEKRR